MRVLDRVEALQRKIEAVLFQRIQRTAYGCPVLPERTRDFTLDFTILNEWLLQDCKLRVVERQLYTVQRAVKLGDKRAEGKVKPCIQYGWHYEARMQVIRMILAGVFEGHPALKVISGHWGEMVPYFLYRLDQMFKPEVTGLSDTVSNIYRKHVWISPSGLYDNDALQFCVNKLGIDHLVFSADWPYVPMTDARAFVENAPLSDIGKEKFSHLTAEGLLHLSE